jgi:hypothetical protein
MQKGRFVAAVLQFASALNLCAGHHTGATVIETKIPDRCVVTDTESIGDRWWQSR